MNSTGKTSFSSNNDMPPSAIVIEAGSMQKKYWLDLWRYRDLFYILSWRDIKVRYKQTAIGALWSIGKPFLAMVIFTVVFSKIAGLPSSGSVPYALLVFSAMLPWQFFSSSISESSMSLISNANLISKVYFPRMIIPVSTLITALVDFLIASALLVLLFFYYDFFPGWQMIFMPFFLLLAFITSLGISLFITSMNVKYRDFRFIVPFIVQFGLYVSPVGYSSSVISEKYRLVYALNPMVGVIDGFRWCLLQGEQPLHFRSLIVSILCSCIFLWIGIRQFRRMERSFADII
jgi:lipopolysaccharide transport system permease protein